MRQTSGYCTSGGTGVSDPRTSRRSDFHNRKGIRLADGRVWTFPAPAERWSSSPDAAFGADYLGLIRAILEAENEDERRLAELALAMLLIGLQHSLTSSEYHAFSSSSPYSQELADSQAGFHDLALDHVEYLKATGFFWDRPIRPVLLPACSAAARPASRTLERSRLVQPPGKAKRSRESRPQSLADPGGEPEPEPEPSPKSTLLLALRSRESSPLRNLRRVQ